MPWGPSLMKARIVPLDEIWVYILQMKKILNRSVGPNLTPATTTCWDLLLIHDGIIDSFGFKQIKCLH